MPIQTKPISASALKSLAKSPEHCYANHLDPDRVRSESEAMLLGTMVHAMLLEPKEVSSRYVRMPDGMIRRGAKWDDFKASNELKTIVKASTWDKAKETVKRVKKDEAAGIFLNGRKRNIFTEQHCEWTEPIDWLGDRYHVDMVGYIDFMNTGTKRMVDIKTTSNADDLSKLAKDGRWDIQAVQYLNYMYQSRGERWQMFFIVVEVNSPFRIRVVELSPVAIQAGRADRERLIKEYMDRSERNDWSGSRGVSEVDMPVWFSRTLEDLNDVC